MDRFRIRARCLVVAAVSAVGMAAVVRLLGGGVTAPAGDPQAGLERVCTMALLAAVGWGWLTVQAGVLDAWRTAAARTEPRPPDRPTSGVRRLVLLACGVALTGTIAGALSGPAAHAATTSWTGSWTGSSAGAERGPAPPATVPAPVVARPAEIVVRSGDCLWSIAAGEVQPGAGPATVTARWRAIYHANHDLIGSDPDVIRPGQHLRLPR